MIYKTTSNQKELLISLPETGMGYQYIELIDWSNFENSKKGVVYNAIYFIEEGEDFNSDQKQLFDKQIKIQSSSLSLISNKYETINILTQQDFFKNSDKSVLNEISSEYNKNCGARESDKVHLANGISEYVRLSAFDDDMRIDKVKKCLLPRSFATTYEDYIKLKDIGERPNERYALPNDETILYAFVIKPAINDTFKKGNVQPANGFKGGGVEVFFENGTSNGTFIKQLNYGRY